MASASCSSVCADPRRADRMKRISDARNAALAAAMMLKEINTALIQDDIDSSDESLNEVSITIDEISLSTGSTVSSDDDSMVSVSPTFTECSSVLSRPVRRGFMLRVRPIIEPTNARRRLRSAHRMPSPSMIATQVANRVIKYARCIKNMYENDMCCLTCGLFPINPITGSCGHTRCIKCIISVNSCPCGEGAPWDIDSMNVNIIIRDVVEKTVPENKLSRLESAMTGSATRDKHSAEQLALGIDMPNYQLTEASGSSSSAIRHMRLRRTNNVTAYSSRRWQILMSSRSRFNQAVELLHQGKYLQAAPLLALAAAYNQPDIRRARVLLAQCIQVINKCHNPTRLMRHLYRIIREKSTMSWIKPKDMECILCVDTFTSPVTTPCGHMFCRVCIERSLDYKKRCPLCLASLREFNLLETRDTKFVVAALNSINVIKTVKPLEPDFIPIFVCTVAFPSVPCPLFIFDPRYWLMIRRVLESGSRKFGMVACDRNQTYSKYGTILEVRDCVHLEDGRSILSTVGLSRFKVIERCVRDGCEVARILPIVDTVPHERIKIMDFKFLASQILFKVMAWLKRLNPRVKADIIDAFGNLVPPVHNILEGCYTPDGPAWLWWVVAVLPLRSEIKVLILSTDCIFKRMLAVSGTLEAVDQVSFTTATAAECELRHSQPSENQPTPSSSVNGGDVPFNVYASLSSETAE